MAQLGYMDPCEQIREIHDASVMIVVTGAEQVMSMFMPEYAVLIEIDATVIYEDLRRHQLDFFTKPGPGWVDNHTVSNRYREEAQRVCGS